MFGKGSLLMVFGFILTFSVYQNKLNHSVLRSADNFNMYYMKTIVHETALTAMNFGINRVWDQDVTSDTFHVVVNNCSTIVSISPLGLDTVKVKVKAWGYAFENEFYASNSDFMKVEDSLSAYFSYQMSLSKYFWFTNNEGYVYWISGDTVWGPVHTNTVLRTSGSPVFYGKVTAYRGIYPNPARRSNPAHFYGGWEVGVKVDYPTDMSHLIAAANAGNGSAPPNEKSIYNKPVSFEFLPDGKVIRQVDTDPPDTVSIASIAPTGVIYSSENVRVKGTLNGQLTIYSENNIYIDDDIVYADDPTTNPNSDDILGLVAGQNVLITDNVPNSSDVHIQACIMAIYGSYGAENYSTRPVSGTIYLTGSIAQEQRGPVGTFSWWTGSVTHGFLKNYRYDPRLVSLAPPYYPYVRALRLVSWWE